jgi:hypothetical protein
MYMGLVIFLSFFAKNKNPPSLLQSNFSAFFPPYKVKMEIKNIVNTQLVLEI